MLSRMCCARSAFNVSQSLHAKVPSELIPKNYVLRTYARESRTRPMTGTRPTLRERLLAPAGPNAYGIGKGALVGASAVGIGALCFYGSGVKPGTLQESQQELPALSRLMDSPLIKLGDFQPNLEMGLVTNPGWQNWLINSKPSVDCLPLYYTVLWPQYVKDRIKTTYSYIAGSLVITAGSAVAVFRTPALLNLVTRSGWISIIVTMALMIGSGMVVRSMPYTPGLGAKQLAWLVHTGIMGAVIAPLCFLGGPILTRAALYTAGVVGGLSTVAICAPSGEFLSMRAPLAMGLGAVFAASLASMFIPTTTALGAGIYSLALYGGLIVFGGFLLYDTQVIIKKAEQHPPYGFQPYDPINSAIAVYLDILNIFMRIAMILSGSGGNRRK